jgi:CHAT domain-containing protein
LVIQDISQRPLPQIPKAYDESFDIVKLFPQARLERATLQRGDAGLELGNLTMPKTDLSEADLVHYAGHGVDENSNQQEAHVSGSVITIARGSLPHCRLAVLAACQTMRERESSAQNVPSVARVFMAAGASHVLATQWDVDSKMTRFLMIRFYAELADHQTFDEALRRAQVSLQSEASSSHPYFWSAFELVGQ